MATTLFALVASGPLEINAPSLTQCKPAYLSWVGKYPPFNVTVINDQSGKVLKAFGLREGNNLTWTCDLPGRTEVSVKITDAKGNINWSNGVWIKNTTDTSCLSSVVDVSSGSGGLVTAGNGTTPIAPAGGVGAANATMPAHSSGIGANAAATTSRAASAASQTTALASASIALVALVAAGLCQLA